MFEGFRAMTVPDDSYRPAKVRFRRQIQHALVFSRGSRNCEMIGLWWGVGWGVVVRKTEVARQLTSANITWHGGCVRHSTYRTTKLIRVVPIELYRVIVVYVYN